MKTWQSPIQPLSSPNKPSLWHYLNTPSIWVLLSLLSFPQAVFQEQTCLSMSTQHNPWLYYSSHILKPHNRSCLTPSMYNPQTTFLSTTEKTPPSHCDHSCLLFSDVLNMWVLLLLQNKQLACHQCKTYRGKINEAVLCFAHMANFGNASSRVYFKEKIALSVFSKCADLLPPLLSLGASKPLYSNPLAVFTS